MIVLSSGPSDQQGSGPKCQYGVVVGGSFLWLLHSCDGFR